MDRYQDSQKPTIAIVGCGFSGVALAVAVLNRVRRPIRLLMIDPASEPGMGLAYGAARRDDLLNARVRDMGLFADHPGDFSTWIARRNAVDGSAYGGDDFVPRQVFGRYVQERYRDAIDANPSAEVVSLHDEAIGVRRDADHFLVTLQNGAPLAANIVVIASGYGVAAAARFGLFPYDPALKDKLAGATHAYIIGAGPTAVDAALYLSTEIEDLRLTLISRRGVKPLSHAPAPVAVHEWTPPFPATTIGLFAMIRDAASNAEATGGDWRSVINGLRPHVPAIWRQLPAIERRRFLTRLRPYWEAHRHRLPPENGRRLDDLVKSGRLEFRAGQLRAGAPVEIRWRGEQAYHALTESPIVDCAGHAADVRAPLLASMIAGGLAFVDELGAGLKVDHAGRLLNDRGEAAPDLFAIGPLGAASLLEITAAPEIAAQAQRAAALIAQTFAPAPVGTSTAHE